MIVRVLIEMDDGASGIRAVNVLDAAMRERNEKLTRAVPDAAIDFEVLGIVPDSEVRAGVVAEEPERPLRPIANASDYEAGMRWMCDDGSVWETRWDAQEQQWVWGLVSVPVKQEGADDAGTV